MDVLECIIRVHNGPTNIKTATAYHSPHILCLVETLYQQNKDGLIRSLCYLN